METQPEKPNVLWILTTQWRAQATGYAGDPNARTPALDALAARSINFAQAVTPHPFGPFARAAILTGVASPQNGVRDYYDPLPKESRTIAHEMAARGYLTAHFGKWHLSKRDPAAPLVGEAHAKMLVPEEARGGFEFWEGFESGFLLNDPWLHGTRLPQSRQFHGYQTDVLCERAGEWWKAQRSADVDTRAKRRPVFCVVSLESPHPPYDAPAAGVLSRPPQTIDLRLNVPLGGDVEQRARRELAGYYAHIEATDRAIGRLVENVGDDTLVVFTSVHGDMHGAHGLFRKGWPHEESVRVPLLVCPPAIYDCGARRRHDAVSLLDLARFTLAAVQTRGAEWPRSKFAPISMPSVVPLPNQCDRTWAGLRSAGEKFIWNDDGSPWLCFDLKNDPFERTNLAMDPKWLDRIRELAASIQKSR